MGDIYKLLGNVVSGEIKCLQEDPKVKILDLKTPLKKSVQMLRAMIKFWHVKSYQEFLSKDFIEKNEQGLDKMKLVRALDKQVGKFLTEFALSDPVYFANDAEKSCFFINLYNTAMLLKMAEISILEPRKTFEIRDWHILEKSATLILKGHPITAYELRNDLKKLNP